MHLLLRRVLGPAVVIAGAVTVASAASTNDAGTIVLDASGFWRAHFTFRQPVLRNAAGGLDVRPPTTGDTAAPPGNWTAGDFVDRDWPRMPGFLFPAGGYNRPIELRHAGYTEYEPTSANLGLICLRGKFAVSDPAAVRNVHLAVSFRGGLAVYLNGREIARDHLPGAATGPDALAEDYPLDAFLKPDGTVLGGPYLGTAVDDPEALRRWRLRVRTCERDIPPSALRKGVNVLALEIHRAAYPQELYDRSRKVEFHLIPSVLWSTSALLDVRLRGEGAGLAPDAAGAPAGLRIWNSPPINPDYDLDRGDPNEPPAPIRLVGPRGGSVSGKVVCGRDGTIRGLRAALAGDLVSDAGRIPAAAAKIRYAVANGWEQAPPGSYALAPRLFDGLSDTPPETVTPSRGGELPPWFLLPDQRRPAPGAVQPVWITVAVPTNAPAGGYHGALTVQADGVPPVTVPVELRVCPWVAPPPAQFRTVVDLIQSPESVALQYGVEPYGEAHFRYLARSFDLLGYVGNWTLYVPLIARCNLGNEQSMVRWVKGADGRWQHDFTAMEKYLDLTIAHMGRPKIVVLYVWDLHIGGTKTHHQDERVAGGGQAFAVHDVPVSRLDPATGRVTPLMLPAYGEAVKADWQAVADGVMERLRRRGLADAAQLGMGSDGRPTAEIIAFLAEAFHHLPWARGGHYEWKNMGNSQEPLGLQDNVYPYKLLADPARGEFSCFGWNRPETRALFVRTYEPAYPMTFTRMLPEITVLGAQRGLGRIGLDLWPVLPNAKGERTGVLQGRYPDSDWHQLDAMIKAFVPPGPDGAMASAHLEMLREGLQESEARIVIERALLDAKLRARLGDALAARCRRVLDDRAKALLPNCEQQASAGFAVRDPGLVLNGWDNYAYAGLRSLLFFRWYQHSGWQDRTERLFEVAGEVDAALR